MRDEEFVCKNCGQSVNKLLYSARDHCPYCLISIHIDNNPGDRECLCHGTLLPCGLEKYRNTYKIVYKCERCGIIKRNIMAEDDDMETLIKISSHSM